MKRKIKVLVNSFLFVLLAMLSSVYSFAESDDIYDHTSSGHAANIYNGLVPYIVFGAVVLFLGYIGYRYWHDNAKE